MKLSIFELQGQAKSLVSTVNFEVEQSDDKQLMWGDLEPIKLDSLEKDDIGDFASECIQYAITEGGKGSEEFFIFEHVSGDLEFDWQKPCESIVTGQTRHFVYELDTNNNLTGIEVDYLNRYMIQ